VTTQLRFLGVAGVEVVSPAGVHVAVDPFISGDPALGLGPSPVRIQDLDDTDLVLVSHGARDHYGDAAAIAKRSGALVGCGPDVRLRLLRDGLPENQIAKLLPGVRRQVGDVAVKALRANHVSFHEFDGGWVAGPPLCFALDVDGRSLFHAGDTALFGDLEMIGRLYRPEVAILPIGATEAGVEFMPPEDAAIALDWLGAKVAVPVHFPPGSRAVDAFVAAVDALGLDARVRPLEPGERMELP
jgi:L-ascorbate metabolism protein UlaG (beta-lactamase superfamily)